MKYEQQNLQSLSWLMCTTDISIQHVLLLLLTKPMYTMLSTTNSSAHMIYFVIVVPMLS